MLHISKVARHFQKSAVYRIFGIEKLTSSLLICEAYIPPLSTESDFSTILSHLILL